MNLEGQINRGTEMGEMIYELSNKKEVLNIVEIGTWNGLGSTKCIIDAIVDSNDSNKKLFSVELYPDLYQLAIKNLKLFLNDPRITILNGRIIEYDDVFWFDHRLIDFRKDHHAKLWYQKDLQHLQAAQNVLHLLPQQIDLLVLDGGEYTTYPEWKILHPRTQCFVLDDVNTLKCSQIRKEAATSKDWSLIYENLKSRNGFSIFTRATI